ncbi:conserved Plasmodium protein, unknown function [Plasmodium sp. gorilla clade G2]|uniref:conserved Plasmodium protein, unknown function n=1 Tax=Plasmodium sp. gorilla clade G2 TaxID=880535 RepID=UPI000D20B0E3|nr:conserved Plasmodium protein, unknown function [Plasmodium sp. gorilla clade G2]SOV11589.1 conserved Plasmodium protein, unknown function [Plasmodium sp. gorilla clade G2]
MSINRINKIILCSRIELKSIDKIDFYAEASNNIVKNFCDYFLPQLKYNNFNILYTFNKPEKNTKEKIVLFTRNGETHIINLSLYKYSHQLYERIIYLDKKFLERH